jgi:2-polyprenyl-3-methyl-5-hydroxy-6-metoxy-1,4-benzoquinol methylase
MKKITNYTERPNSVITGKDNLEHLHTLKDFPVFFGCVETPREEDLVADMGWYIDPETGVIQLTKLIPLEILYQAQHVDGVGTTWQRYYEDFAKYIKDQRVESVLEIGGGQGKIAEIVTSKSKEIKWTIVEPNPLHKGNSQISIIKGFFDKDFKSNKKVDTVVFSQVLEHAYDPKSFIETIANFLKTGDKLVFAYPNLKIWLEKKFTNAINFEHSMFLTDYFIDYILAEFGFKIKDKTAYNEHSIFYTAEKESSPILMPEIENKYEEYKKIFLDFVKYHENLVESLNKKMEESNSPIYLFGGHIFSQYLIGFGLKTEKIVNILDNSILKIDKRFYGTDIMVRSPKILKGKGAINIILKAGVYNEEIKKDILENINKDVIFW